MRPHIKETIRELSAEIGKLQGAIILLQNLDAGSIERAQTELNDELRQLSASAPAGDATPRNGQRPRKVKPVKTRVATGGGTLNSRSQSLELSRRVVEIAARLKQPFSVQQFMAACDITTAKAYGYLWRWKNAFGWVKSLGRDSYERTAAFGGADFKASKPAVGRITIPGLDKEEKTLAQQLDQALAERDRARGAGNETLAKIYQDKADKLQARLEE